MTENDVEPEVGKPRTNWLAIIGTVGFLFFFIKGIAWLIVPFLVIWWFQ